MNNEDNKPIQYLEDLTAHKHLVSESLGDMMRDLLKRAETHDNSKYSHEERDIYEQVTPLFQGVKYGTPEHEVVKAKLGPALDHHYQHNDHHPEHFENGIAQMDIMQLCEMVADWYAAIRRDPNAHFEESLQKLKDKYHLHPQLFSIITNTVLWLRNGGVR